MQHMVQSEMVILRASPEFVAMLSRTAADEGLSKSEVVRRAVSDWAGEASADELETKQ